jgi:hypothetical protein
LKTLKNVDPMSLATITGVLGALWGLLVAIAAIFIRTAFTSMMGRFYTIYTNMMPDLTLGVAALIVLPLMYGLTGFVASYIGALIYNAVAKKFGGVKLDIN